MNDHVDNILKLWRSTPFTWGGVMPSKPGYGDCMLSIGEYLATRGLPDLTGRWRGTYSDEAGALAHVAACGGICGLMALTGLETINDPARGDVVCFAATSVSGIDTEIGAICTGAGIVARLERGVVEVDMRLVKIVQSWKVP